MIEESQKTKNEIVEREEKILEFWNKNGIFKKSEEKEAPEGEFVFYDGPPFATGLPHYGHILAGTIKDAIPRYKTMRGFRVRRRWGWDCHGLPLENQIEEELNIKTKKDIEKLGVERFNRAARERVLRYAEDWEKIVPRLGRFVDMEHDYKTMDTSYTESVWWAFKKLHDKGLVYEGFKAMQLCPRCGTTLSNFEVSQGYKDITDLAITVKFELADEPGTALLAWTTTPWTLLGNMALAVNPEAVYVEISFGSERALLAKQRLSIVEGEYQIVREFPGSELVGRKYRPVFDYYKNIELKGKENAWQVYGADFVTMEEGTGIVHIAPAFGEDDLALARANGIPIVHHVGFDGAMKPEVVELAGLQAKPKEDPTRTDVEVLKLLVKKNLLFKKEKVTHSYPHCWRCDTPLLNYAASSWFVEVTKFKDKLVAENKKIHWVPEDIKEGRFGNWLLHARDWAISRSRYWGAPIPVWKDGKGNPVIVGSVEELKKHSKKSGNRYFVMRHGEADSNIRGIVSGDPQASIHLTAVGKEEVVRTAAHLSSVDFIITSPLIRTQETAEMVREKLGLSSSAVLVDDRLREISPGALEGKSIAEYKSFFTSYEERFIKAPTGGMLYSDMKKRIGDFLYELERTHTDKKILLVTHEVGARLLFSVSYGLTPKETAALAGDGGFIKKAETRELPFVPLPHNENYELDLHRPYIDTVKLVDAAGKPLTRVLDVFDCWFESGSMPFASRHYPFENLTVFNPEGGIFKKRRGFPADFISESIDQTRGWFYSLLVLGVALFGQSPYRSVVTNGLVLAEDGRKMSKRLKNYPDPIELVGRWGADALRYYLLSSPVIKGEEIRFSEKNVQDIAQKLVGRLGNVLVFYALYAGEKVSNKKSQHILDHWILARLSELVAEVTAGMENYELDKATRPIAAFIDDLSTWYVRRSRDRFKSSNDEDAQAALATLRHTLLELAKLLAPFMPFFAEYLYQELRETKDTESIHLLSWPRVSEISAADETILDAMAQVRAVVSRALEARASAGIKVRQPLQRLTLPVSKLALQSDFVELIKEEVNVKEVIFDERASDLLLDTAISDALREEGAVRNLIRVIQNLRKEAGLLPKDRVGLTIATDTYGTSLVSRFAEHIKAITGAGSVSFAATLGFEVEIEGHRYTVALVVPNGRP